MKTKLILGSFLAFATIANAQVWTTGTGKETTPGTVGIGTSSPAYKLDIATTSAGGDGIRIQNNGSNGECTLRLDNNTTGGHEYAFFSMGNGNTYPGSFLLHDYTAVAPRLSISSTGNMGVGIENATNGKLEVQQAANGTDAGYFQSITNNLSTSRGITAFAEEGDYNQAATFAANSTYNNTQNIALITSVPGLVNDWAAYFMGRAFCTAGVWSGSDRKLKENIRPLMGALDKIKLLKPSLYSYKTAQYNKMALPEGEQMGLIAQELETVFPSLVTDIKGQTIKNNKGEITSNSPDHKAVNYVNLIPVLIGGIQELQIQVESQKSQIEEQKQVITDLLKKTGVSTGIDQMNGFSEFKMDQNEPNPFNGETTIKYSLPQSVNTVNLFVYDLTGKQITSFPINEKGSSSVKITSENLAAGIYIYSIVADGKMVDSKRMVVAEK